MKTEFLKSIGYSLNVTESDYGLWLNLLTQQLTAEISDQIVPTLPCKRKGCLNQKSIEHYVTSSVV